jgi:hypothetical protein
MKNKVSVVIGTHFEIVLLSPSSGVFSLWPASTSGGSQLYNTSFLPRQKARAFCHKKPVLKKLTDVKGQFVEHLSPT